MAISLLFSEVVKPPAMDRRRTGADAGRRRRGGAGSTRIRPLGRGSSAAPARVCFSLDLRASRRIALVQGRQQGFDLAEFRRPLMAERSIARLSSRSRISSGRPAKAATSISRR